MRMATSLAETGRMGLVFLLLSFLSFSESIITSDTSHYRLYNDVLQHYNKYLVPIENVKNNISIQIHMHLLRIVKMDESCGIVSISGRTRVKWKDEILQWDPTKYENIYTLQVPYSKIWLPQFSAVQTGQILSTDWGSSTVVLSFSGWIEVNLPLSVDITCDINMKYFPFDSQRCGVQLRLNGEHMVMSWKSSVATESLASPLGWNINDYRSYVISDTLLHFDMKLSRKGYCIIFLAMWPSIFLVIMDTLYILGTVCHNSMALGVTALTTAALALIRLLVFVIISPNNSGTLSTFDIFFTTCGGLLVASLTMKSLCNRLRSNISPLHIKKSNLQCLERLRNVFCMSKLKIQDDLGCLISDMVQDCDQCSPVTQCRRCEDGEQDKMVVDDSGQSIVNRLMERVKDRRRKHYPLNLVVDLIERISLVFIILSAFTLIGVIHVPQIF